MLPTHYNTPTVKEEKESSRPYVECEVPRKLLLYRDQLIPPLKIGFERFEVNFWMVQQFLNSRRSRIGGGVRSEECS